MIFNSVDNRLSFIPIRTILVEFANENGNLRNLEEAYQEALSEIETLKKQLAHKNNKIKY